MTEDGRKVILLVEDEAIIAVSEKKILSRYGFAIMTAGSGEEAIADCRKNPDIDLVLMDINLGPGMDGTEAASVILEEFDLPLIFLSSHSERDVVEKTEGITSYGYIVKNSGETVLIASIKMAFRLFELHKRELVKDAAIAENEVIFRHFMDKSPIFVFFKDDKIRSLRLSTNYEKMIGRPLSELLGKNMDELFPSDLAKSMVADDIRILNEGREITIEEEFNGHYYTTTKFPIVIDGVPRYLAGYTIDITEKKKHEQDLQFNEARIRAIFEQASVGIAQIDVRTSRFSLVNSKFAEMTGYPQDEILDRTFAEITHPDDLQEDEEMLRNLHDGIFASFCRKKRYIRKDGTTASVRLTVSAIRDTSGDPEYYLAIAEEMNGSVCE